MLQCQEPLCGDISHSEKRDATVLDILSAIVETSHTCLPLTGRTGGSQKQDREVIPGWSAEVEPQRQRSNYCYRAWLAGGKPSHGELHRAKLDSHCAYRYAVRRVKQSARLQQAKGLFAAAKEGDLALMKEMRRVQLGRGDQEDLSETVDGATGHQEV